MCVIARGGCGARRRDRCALSPLSATRPARPSYLQNYKTVIRPRLWRTLWITFCGEWMWTVFAPLGSAVPPHVHIHSALVGPRSTRGLDLGPTTALSARRVRGEGDRKRTRLNSTHV